MRLSSFLLKCFVAGIIHSYAFSCLAAFDAPLFKEGISRSAIDPSIRKVMWNANGGPFIAESIVESDESGVYYWLFRASSINKFDVANKKNVDGWPLNRWKYQYYSPEVAKHYSELRQPYPLSFEYEHVAPGVGCLGSVPLRFGDVEGDGPKELAIILDDFFILFSPAYGRTVYAEYLDESDWMDKGDMENFFDQNPVTNVQYTSRLLAENGVIDAGVRAYTKLFFGDFDKDGNADILAWRKSYRANLSSDQTTGFTKLQDIYQHFERDLVTQTKLAEGITGEYLPQSTEVDVVKMWLADSGLTWQKGYPSKSECPGQKDQLIPEMHDPLLNDPEVLQ